MIGETVALLQLPVFSRRSSIGGITRVECRQLREDPREIELMIGQLLRLRSVHTGQADLRTVAKSSGLFVSERLQMLAEE